MHVDKTLSINKIALYLVVYLSDPCISQVLCPTGGCRVSDWGVRGRGSVGDGASVALVKIGDFYQCHPPPTFPVLPGPPLIMLPTSVTMLEVVKVVEDDPPLKLPPVVRP